MSSLTVLVIITLFFSKFINYSLEELKTKNVLAVGFGPQTIRLVTHLDFTDEMLDDLIKTLRTLF